MNKWIVSVNYKDINTLGMEIDYFYIMQLYRPIKIAAKIMKT